MEFSSWRSLTPGQAVHRLLDGLPALPEQARRAALAWVADSPRLERAFAASAGPLAGIPFAAKDLFDVRGLPTRAGSTFLPEILGLPRRDALLVEHLFALGGVLAAKTHLHEFAYGLSGENPHFGAVPHPTLPGRLTGGSSSGSAWAVASGWVPLALGTDTAGSIRVPAAFCGIFGMRWAHGSWGQNGVIPLSPSYDAAGWFTRTAGDMIETITALAGAPPSRPLRGLAWHCPHLDFAPGVRATYARQFAEWGCREHAHTSAALQEAFEGSGQAYAVLNSREAYAWHQAWLDERKACYDPSVWPLIDRGRRWPALDIQTAEEKQRLVRSAWEHYFQEHDFLVLPAVHGPAPRREDIDADYRHQLLALNTPASLAQLPVLSVPLPLPAGGTLGAQIVFSPHRPRDAVNWLNQHGFAGPTGSP